MTSYPALEDWFSTSVRRNRQSFMLAALALTAVVAVVFLVIGWFKLSSNVFLLVILPFGIAFIACWYLLTAQRIRDIGLTGWLALLWIPVNMADSYLQGAAALAACIVLCSVPGTRGAKRYGPDPLNNRDRVTFEWKAKEVEKIVHDWGAFMERNPSVGPTEIWDVKNLPHDKEAILDAICFWIAVESDERGSRRSRGAHCSWQTFRRAWEMSRSRQSASILLQ